MRIIAPPRRLVVMAKKKGEFLATEDTPRGNHRTGEELPRFGIAEVAVVDRQRVKKYLEVLRSGRYSR